MKKLSAQFTAVTATFILTPLFAFAQFGEIDTFFTGIVGFINNVLIPLIFAIALLVFLYGVFKYFILGGADPENRKEGTNLMLYAVIGFVLMVSIFGIVNLVAGGLGFSDDQNLNNIPSAPTTNN